MTPNTSASQMRLDLLLSTLGIVKRRTEAKSHADAGSIQVNNNKAKPGQIVREGDIIRKGGAQPWAVEILKIPSGSVRKDMRESYFRKLAES